MTDEDPRPAAAVYRVSGSTGRHEPAAGWFVVVAVFLVILVLKPWSSGDPSIATPSHGARPNSPPVDAARPPDGAPARLDPASAVADICLDAGTWLVTSVQRDQGKTIRVWRAILPASGASGPLDPSIPQTQVRSEGVLELGWCAPDRGAEAPSQGASIDAWSTDGGDARPIHLVDPRPETSPYGALYLPLEPSATIWAPGVYVFRHASGGAADRWFSLRIEAIPSVRG